MSTPKAEALRIVERFPDDITWDSLVYRLFVVAKVKEGMAEIDAGLGMPHDEFVKEMETWRASYGRRTPAAPPESPMTISPATPS